MIDDCVDVRTEMMCVCMSAAGAGAEVSRNQVPGGEVQTPETARGQPAAGCLCVCVCSNMQEFVCSNMQKFVCVADTCRSLCGRHMQKFVCRHRFMQKFVCSSMQKFVFSMYM